MIFISLINVNRKNTRPTSKSFDDKIGHGISVNPFGRQSQNETDERVCRFAVQTMVSFRPDLLYRITEGTQMGRKCEHSIPVNFVL